MAVPVLLLGLGLAGAGYLLTQKRTPEGWKDPFDQAQFPPGFDLSRKIAVEQVNASSGSRYKLTSFRSSNPSSDPRHYYVAEKQGDLDWCSYLFTPATGARQRYHVNADNMADAAAILADFDMAGQLPAGGVS